MCKWKDKQRIKRIRNRCPYRHFSIFMHTAGCLLDLMIYIYTYIYTYIYIMSLKYEHSLRFLVFCCGKVTIVLMRFYYVYSSFFSWMFFNESCAICWQIQNGDHKVCHFGTSHFGKRSCHKNIARHTVHTDVPWPNPKQWQTVHTSDLIMIIIIR